MSDMFRGFIAIDLPDELRAVIASTQKSLHNLPGHLKWVNPSSVHLTLKFLGQTCRDLVAPLSETMDNLAKQCTPFELYLENTGVFPNMRRPRVVWIGIHGDVERLLVLQKKVETAVEPFGFPPENRAFKPHLTLARVKSAQSPHHWTEIMEKTVIENSPSFRVSSFYLFESILRPTGAQYVKLACFRY